MKYLFTFSFIAFGLLAQAQRRVSLGIEGGWNSASQSFDPFSADWVRYEEDARSAFNLSVLVDLRLTKNLSLQSGVSYQQKGAKLSETYHYPPYVDFVPVVTDDMYPGEPWRSTLYLNYLEIPLFLSVRVKVASGISVFTAAGPYAAIGLGGSRKNPDGTKRDNIFEGNAGSNGYQKEDYGLNFKAGAELRRLYLSLKYGMGLYNIAPDVYPVYVEPNGSSYAVDIERDKVKNKVFSVSLGYWFW